MVFQTYILAYLHIFLLISKIIFLLRFGSLLIHLILKITLIEQIRKDISFLMKGSLMKLSIHILKEEKYTLLFLKKKAPNNQQYRYN